jgi:hypothetical protein
VLCFLDRPVFRAAPILWGLLSNCMPNHDDDYCNHTHLSAEDAIRFAILEYLHVDCRLMHARQSGRLRSHCTRFQRWRSSNVVVHVATLSTSASIRACTHLGFAFYALLAAQCWLIALLFFLMWLIESLRAAVRTLRIVVDLHNAQIHVRAP